MKASSAYQAILQEGREEGQADGERKMLIIMGSKRFGEPDAQMQAALNNIHSPQRLEQLAIRIFEVEAWQELLQ